MKRCSICGKRIWFNNYQVCLEIGNILERGNIRPGGIFYCCKKCIPKLKWDLDCVAKQMSCEVTIPIESIITKMGVLNSEEK